MKIIIPLLKGVLKKSGGDGQRRLVYELYKNFKESKVSIDLDEINGNILTLILHNMFKRFVMYDIIFNPYFLPIIPLNKRNTKFIIIITDLQPIVYPKLDDSYNTISSILFNVILKFGISLQIKMADKIISISTQTTKEIKDIYGKRACTINLGVDNRFLEENKAKLKKESKNFIVGYIGSFAKRKNINFAIKCMQACKCNDTILKIYGKKNFEYKKVINLLKSTGNANYMGVAPENKLVQIYDSFDVFVFPSLYEGFGLPILEAQSRGLPVIIYKYGKIPKEVRKYCFEAESPEHMAQIIEDLKENGYNEKLRKKATNYARSFTWVRFYENVFGVLQKISV